MNYALVAQKKNLVLVVDQLLQEQKKQKLEALEKMYHEGLISEQSYQNKKRSLES